MANVDEPTSEAQPFRMGAGTDEEPDVRGIGTIQASIEVQAGLSDTDSSLKENKTSKEKKNDKEDEEPNYHDSSSNADEEEDEDRKQESSNEKPVIRNNKVSTYQKAMKWMAETSEKFMSTYAAIIGRLTDVEGKITTGEKELKQVKQRVKALEEEDEDKDECPNAVKREIEQLKEEVMEMKKRQEEENVRKEVKKMRIRMST